MHVSEASDIVTFSWSHHTIPRTFHLVKPKLHNHESLTPIPSHCPGTAIHLGPWVVNSRAPIWVESCSVCWGIILEELTFSLKLCLFTSEESAFRERLYEGQGVRGADEPGPDQLLVGSSGPVSWAVPHLYHHCPRWHPWGIVWARFLWCPCSPPPFLLVGEGAACWVVSTPVAGRTLQGGPIDCGVWSQEHGAHVGHSIRAVTRAQATSSPTHNVPKTPLRRAWWVVWDPRGPVSVVEFREHVPHGLQIHPCISAISSCPVFECRKTTSTDHCPQHNARSCQY